MTMAPLAESQGHALRAHASAVPRARRPPIYSRNMAPSARVAEARSSAFRVPFTKSLVIGGNRA